MPNDLDAMKKSNLTHNELIEFTHTLAFAVRRDILDFADYNVSETDVEEMITLCDQFEALPSDEAYRNEISSLAEEKENLKIILFKYSRNITMRAKVVFGDKSIKYKTLNCGTLSQYQDLELAAACKYQSTQALINLTALQVEGLTQAYLTEFNTQIELFEAKIFEMKDKTIAREDATELRILTANKLYTTILRFCDYGKLIFDGVSPAKYNDYIIYAPSAGSLTPPDGLNFSPTAAYISWIPVEHATSYELQYASDGESWNVVYAGSDTGVEFIPPTEGWAYFRCRARNNNGFGEFSDVLKTGYYQTLPPPTNIQVKLVQHSVNEIVVTWDEVPSATVYKLYTSIVPIGAAAGSFEFLGRIYTPSYSGEVTQAKRHYFQLTAENSSQYSGRSVNAYIDVE